MGLAIAIGAGASAIQQTEAIQKSTGSAGLDESRLKALIGNTEKKLDALESEGKANSAEAARLNMQLERYQLRMDKLEDSQNASEKNQTADADKKRRFDSFECQTCKNRRYQDESTDAGVSFKSASKVAPSAADSAVRAHENEHVARNQTKAKENGMKILSQTVTIHHAICPECGKVYTSGGVTKTKMATDLSQKYSAGMFDDKNGAKLNTVA